MKHTLISFACYLCLGVVLNVLSPEEWATAQYVAFFTALGLVAIIDFTSFRNGLTRGLAISSDVLHDLCTSKKIKVVPNVDR